MAVAPDPFSDADPHVMAAVRTAARWLVDAGYVVDEVVPPGLRAATDLWHRLVINEERRGLAPAIKQYGDDRSRYNLECHMAYAPHLDGDQVLAAFEDRQGVIRAWQVFMER